MANAATDRIAELERALRADPGGDTLAALLVRVLAGAGRGGELQRRLSSWLDAEVEAGADTGAEPIPARAPQLSESEFDRAFDAAESDLAQMITPDSIAEEAAWLADRAPEERSPLAASSAFATRTMAELLERQGDRRGAARIRAALGEPNETGPVRKDVIAVLERWLENARRLER